MHENSGNSVIYYAHYTEDGVNKTGLTVTITVYEVIRDGTKTEVVTDGACTEIGDGLYRYLLASGTVDAAAEYVAVFHTATDTVDVQDIPAMWVIDRAGTEKLDTGVTLADDAITAAKFDESTAYPLKSADTGTTQVARVGADSDTLETLSDEIAAVKAETALIVEDTGTTIPATITTIDNFLDTEVAAILADTNELQTDLVDGGRLDLLIDGIKAKTDTITAAPTAASVADAVWDEAIVDHSSVGSFGAKNQKVVPSETVGDYKADVSLLATSAALATVDTNVDSVLADTNEIQAELADGGRTDLLIDSIVDATTATGVLLKDDAIEAIFNDVVVTGTYTFAQLMKIMASALAGKLSGGGSTTLTFKSVDGASDVIVATVDANGNRSALTLTV